MKRLKRFLRLLGPGLITGAADDDPSGIATYSQAGAQFGYGQLWTAFFSTPFMIVIQEMVGRIGLVTGKGLSRVIREEYPRWILYGSAFLLLVANTLNIGADLGAMAASLRLLVHVPFALGLVGMAGLILVLEVFVSYKTYARFLKYLSISILTYILVAFVVREDWGAVFRATLLPAFSLEKTRLLNIVAILGTTISPYLFFWQADEEVEEEITEHKSRGLHGKGARSEHRVARMRLDTIAGMIFSNVVMFFIIVTAASTLGAHGLTHVATADQAAEALRPLAGSFTFFLFTLGIVGTGLLAVPVLAGSASYALSEAFGWRAGLYRKFPQARAFYGVIVSAMLVGLLVNFLPLHPFELLYYVAVLNGIIAPPLILLILLISSNKRIMGTYANSPLSALLGWILVIFMTLAAGALFFVN